MKFFPDRNTSRYAAIAFCALTALLSGCSDNDDHVLPGERISVLQLQTQLQPSPELKSTPITLPETWVNKFWPQTGGYPNHAMGHVALGANLKKAWSASVGKGGDVRDPLTAGPIAAENLVFTIDTAGTVTAFDIQTGKKKWEQSVVPRGEEDTGALGGGLAYAAGKLFVTCGYKSIVAIDPNTGAQVWKAPLTAPARSAPTVMDDKVYVITFDNKLYSFSAADGTPQWNYAGLGQTTNLLGSAAPAADATLVVLPLSSGEIFGLRPENGQVVWEDNLSAVRRAGALSSIADIRGLPVIDQGVVFAVSYSGRMVALDQITGKRLWQREVGSAEMPWAAGDTIFLLSTEEQMTALSRQSGGIYWVADLPRFEDKDHDKPIVWTAPLLAGGRLLTASSNGELRAFDPLTGKLLQKTDIGEGVTIDPIVTTNTLLILSQDGTLTAWR